MSSLLRCLSVLIASSVNSFHCISTWSSLIRNYILAAGVDLVLIKYNNIYSNSSESMPQMSMNIDIKTVVSKYNVVILLGFNSEIDSLATNIIVDRKQVDNSNNNNNNNNNNQTTSG